VDEHSDLYTLTQHCDSVLRLNAVNEHTWAGTCRSAVTNRLPDGFGPLRFLWPQAEDRRQLTGLHLHEGRGIG
jgi:hypothetical protein